MKRLILFFCSPSFKCLVKERSHQLDMNIPVYLKYLVAKDVEKIELNNEVRYNKQLSKK